MESQNITILVADDNIINQKVVEFILRKINLSCDFAGNGEEAYLMYKKNKYNIVFMDMQMPILDGIEATKKIRNLEVLNSDNHRAKIFAVTAGNQLDDSEECKAAGLDGVIYKPLRESVLLEVINDFKEEQCH